MLFNLSSHLGFIVSYICRQWILKLDTNNVIHLVVHEMQLLVSETNKTAGKINSTFFASIYLLGASAYPYIFDFPELGELYHSTPPGGC